MRFSLRHWLGSLKLRLSLGGIFALALGIGVTTTVLEQRARVDTLAAREQADIAEAERVARMLGRQVLLQQRALAAVAEQLPVQSLGQPTALREYLHGKPTTKLLFDSVTIVDADGLPRLMQDADGMHRSEVSLADRPFFRTALAERRAVISEPTVSRLSGELVVEMAHPLREGRGVLVGTLRLKTRDLLGGITDGQGDDAAGLLLVSDAQGRILAHQRPELLGAPLTAVPELARALESWRAAGAPVEPAGLAYPDAHSLVAMAGVAGPDWLVWKYRDRAEVLAPLVDARREALHWAVGLIAALSLLTYLTIGALLRPLARVQARAEHLFDEGRDPLSGWPGASGEIGRLEAVLRRVGAERTQLERVKRDVLQRLQSVMGAAPIGIAFSRARRFELVSAQWCRLLGCADGALLGELACTIFASNEDYARLGPLVRESFARGHAYEGDWALLRGDGSRFWGRLRAQPVSPTDAVAGTIWTLHDVTEEIASREKLEWSAHHDRLTGLANRAALERRLALVFADVTRAKPAALLMLDLDRFKLVNDRHGHAAGDAVLRAVSAAAAMRVRESDLLVRLGGDEFALVLERCTTEVALRLADDLSAAVTGVQLRWNGELLGVGVSVGVAMLDEHIAGAEDWLAAADRACYEAKAAGRACEQQPAPLRLVADARG